MEYPDLNYHRVLAESHKDSALSSSVLLLLEVISQQKEQLQWTVSEDNPIPEDSEIDAAHPMETGRHDLYQEAMRMVGAKYSKFALVGLVNWLLYRYESKIPPTVNDFREKLRSSIERMKLEPTISNRVLRKILPLFEEIIGETEAEIGK